jgi:DNA modification methylase
MIDDGDVRIWHGDVIECLRDMPDGIAQTCVTSPPYWGLRDYGEADQIGLESTPEAYVERIVEVFREVRRVLRDDGTLWLNLGDSYAGSGPNRQGEAVGASGETNGAGIDTRNGLEGLKPKDLVGIPWRVAFALQADGWYLRSDIIWAKPNPMPESVTDRPTKSHEYVFLLSKSARYYYDAEAIKEPSLNLGVTDIRFGGSKYGDSDDPKHATKSGNTYVDSGKRNARSVWRIATKPYAEAHFATFPIELPERCIKAGSSEAGECCACGSPFERVVIGIAPDGREAEIRAGKTVDAEGRPLIGDNMIDAGTRGSFSANRGILRRRTDGWRASCACNDETTPQTILDPFMGSGTTAWVARHLNRHAIGCELNADYITIARKRLAQQSLFAEETRDD